MNPETTSRLTVEVSRKVAYGSDAITRLPAICSSLGFKNIILVSGSSFSRDIVVNEVRPLIVDKFQIFRHEVSGDRDAIAGIAELKEQPMSGDNRAVFVAVGGGKVMDMVKVASFHKKIPWISVPTSASHDGFSSPFINFILRERLKKEGLPIPKTTPPVAIIGDTTLIARAPFEHVIAGVGDLLAKFVAVKDWELAHRIRGEPFDEYAAAFGLLSARIVEEGYPIIALGKEPGIRLVVKALGNSGVAMSIAGSTRPASGSEHLISHYFDHLAYNEKRIQAGRHGYQVGVATIFSTYLQGGNWKKIVHILKAVGHPTSFNKLGFDNDIILEAVTRAHTIRPERYTILGNGLTKQAAMTALEETGVAE